MHRHPMLLLVASAAALAAAAGISAADVHGDDAEPMVREIYVPFEELDVLLEDQPQRVLLSRDEYAALVEKAKVVPEDRAPRAAMVVSADYVVTVEPERARLTGNLVVEVLEEGLLAVPLDLSRVSLRRATLDGQNAAIGRAENGPLRLFVEGRGRHQLLLEMVAPVETTAATQVLHVRLPRPPAATLRLTVPGDVEVKSGAPVAGRVVDEAAGVTRFELLPPRGDMTLVMTLNSRLARRQRAVLARSVLVDEVTEAYERLHATVSLRVLHRAVEGFRFAVPPGFEITEVDSPLLARWAVREENGQQVLDVRLREQTIETVVLTLSAVRTARPPDDWTFPKLEPLDVVGQVAVVGLLVDQRLKAESIAAARLIPIDTAVLREAIPETVFRAEPGAPALRPVVAYYAPQSEFELAARFVKPPAEIAVMANVLLLLGEKDQQVRGEFFLSPEVEKLFGFDFTVPPGWHVTSVTTPQGAPLSFERYGEKHGPRRIQVRLPQGVPPGEQYRVYFNAESAPSRWLGKWESTEVEFPVFAVAGATEDVGAVAVEAPDGEMDIRLLKHQNLVPLDARQRRQYGLEESETTGRVLAYRYDRQPYQATLLVERTKPRLTAKTFSFLRVESDALAAHYEIVYQVEQARTRQLSLLFPEETPADLSIKALDGVRLKQFTSSTGEGMRRWTALVEEPIKGTIRLAVDFRQPFPDGEQLAPEQKLKDFALPIVRADGVVYQSGLVAVEGLAELEVAVRTEARRVDAGELAEARREPGRGLLGVFGFVGDPPEVRVDVFRRPAWRLHPTIVERAELTTRLSAAGQSVNTARFELRTKAIYLEVELPPKADLWSADLDQKPLGPQREGDHLLVSVPATSGDSPRSLRIVYEMPVGLVELTGQVELPAPILRLRADHQTEGVEVPMADLVWHLYPPPGYEVVRSEGTVVAELEPPEPAIFTVAKAACGLILFNPLALHVQAAREAGRVAVPTTAYYLEDAQDFARQGGPEAARPPLALPAARPEAGADEAVRFDGEIPEGEEASKEVLMEQMPGMEAVVGETLEALGRRDEDAGEEERRVARLIAEFEQQRARRRLPAPAVMAEPSAEPQEAPPSPAVAAGKPVRSLRRLKGVRSLRIDLEEAPHAVREVSFQSLGVRPRLEVTLAHRPRFDWLAWGVALAVALLGLVLTPRRAAAKFRFILLVILAGSLVPLVPGWEETAGPSNAAVFAACLLVPYYLLAGGVKWFVGLLRRRPKSPAAVVAATIAVLAAGQLVRSGQVLAAKPQARGGSYVIQVVGPPEPVQVPEDAIILPYDPESETGIQDADQMLVPYAKYVELWNRAYPDQKIQLQKPPAAYAPAGASYTTRLEGEEYLLVEGQLEIDVFTEDPVTVPLGLAGGVLTRAELDGKPARLSVPQVPAPRAQAQPAPQSAQQAVNAPAQSVRPPAPPFVVMHVTGKGRHRLDLAVRLRLERRGGWRVAEGVLPSGPAGSLSITVPGAETDVRTGHVIDRQTYQTERADETIETALGPNGAVSIQWRAKVAEGQVDRSLTARSTAVLDVQEDGLRLVWQLALQFRRSRRDVFSVQVPGEYLVEQVEGGNVRGWEVRQEDKNRSIQVSLLKAARDSERFTIHLWRRGPVGEGDLAQFEVPLVTVPDAALHNGRLTIRRSPLVDLRTTATAGVTRTDLSDDASRAALSPGAEDGEQSPLGIRPYEAYEFAATPFSLRLAAAPLAGKRTAEVHTVLKIAEFERSLESQVNLTAQDRPVYRVQMFVPDQLDLEDVSAPGDFLWALTRQDDRPLLTVYLAGGQQGQFPVRITGTLSAEEAIAPLALPRIEVLGVDRQQGEFAIQVDPAFDVEAVDLEHCEKVLRSHIYDWLNPAQLDATRLALRYLRPDYRGTLRLSLRQAAVTCETITNVRVTDRAIEETLLLNFTIEQAGIRQLEFVLPFWMGDCRIQVPMLRQKTIHPVGDQEQAPLRVQLELQDDVMGELRVLVENDRQLTPEAQLAPIPVVRTGRTLRQAVALQSAGRDEVVVDRSQLAGLEPLKRRQSDWEELRHVLGNITEAYLVAAGAEAPRLVFETKQREAYQASGARIGLAETNLVFDPTGAYRAEQVYRLDNTTEQFLVIELPQGAELWTATVAGAPAKPSQVPGAKSPRQVRIPLVKTAPGDLDYAVVLKYGGQMPGLGTLDAVRSPVSFPLVRAVNIKVQLSQVRLYLPETYRWFDFRGTMGLAAEEEELTAEFVSYQTKLAERLMETIEQDGKYAQRRAAGSLKQLGAALKDYHQAARSAVGDRSERLLEEYQKNYELFQQAETQLQQLEQAAQREPVRDNRSRLNTVFKGQKTTRARNVVQDLGSNWARPVDEQMTETAPPLQFNRQWLIDNSLVTPRAQKKSDKADRLSSQRKGKARFDNGKKAPPPAGQRYRGTRFQEKKTIPKGKTPTPRGAGGDAQDRPAAGVELDRFGYLEGQRDAMVRFEPESRMGRALAVTGRPAGPAAAGLPAGLASLDVRLPMRGAVYRFSTPGGEVEITARAVPRKLVDNVIYAAVILGAVLVLLLLVRMARQARFHWLATRLGSWCLILFGLLALCVVPVIGLVAIVAGIVIKVRRATSRLPSTPAPEAQIQPTAP